MSDQPVPAELETHLVVCIGDRPDTKEEKLLQSWITLDESGKVPERLLESNGWSWLKYRHKGARAGGVYRMTKATNGNWYTSGPQAPKYVEMYPDLALRQQWQLLDKMATLEHAKRLKAAKDQSLDTLLVALEPFRTLYRDASRQSRRTILLLAIEYITKGT